MTFVEDETLKLTSNFAEDFVYRYYSQQARITKGAPNCQYHVAMFYVHITEWVSDWDILFSFKFVFWLERVKFRFYSAVTSIETSRNSRLSHSLFWN